MALIPTHVGIFYFCTGLVWIVILKNIIISVMTKISKARFILFFISAFILTATLVSINFTNISRALSQPIINCASDPTLCPLPTGTLGGSGGPNYCTCPDGVAECVCPGNNNDCPVGGPNAGQSSVQCGPGTQCIHAHGISANVTCCSSDGTCGSLGGQVPVESCSGPDCTGVEGPELSPTRIVITREPVASQTNLPTRTVSPTPAILAPSLDLKIRKAGTTNQYQDGLLVLNSGESVDLVWQTSNVSVCDATSGWTGTRDPNGGREVGTPATSNLSSTKIYTLTCVGQGGVVTDFVIASVLNPTPTPAVSCLGGAIGCPTITPTPSVISPTPNPSISTPTPAPAQNLPALDLKGRPLGSGANFTDGPITINFGTAPELQWTSANVTSCTATNGWTGTKNTQGTEAQGNLFNTAIYVLTCTGPNGTVSDSFVVNVIQPTPTPAPNLPFLDLKIRPLNSGQAFTDGPITISQGQPVELQWISQNVSNCVASNGWSGSKTTDGTQATSGLSNSTTFTLTCSGPGGSIVDSVQAIVIIPTPTFIFIPPYIPPYNPPSTPFVDIKIRPFASSLTFTDGPINILPGNGVELQWTSSNVSTCFATGGWSGNRAINGTENAQNLQFSTTFTITCNGPGGTVSDQVTALISAPTNPQISILKSARNITRNSSINNDFVQAQVGDTIEFQYNVRNFGQVVARNVILSDLLPNGLQYIQNSTTRDGIPQPDSITSGLNLGDLQSGESRNVAIRTLVIASSFPEGTSRVSNIARAKGLNIPEITDSVLIEVSKPFVNQTPPPQPANIRKEGRNLSRGEISFVNPVSARPGDSVEFRITVRSGVAYQEVNIRDILPSQFTIIPSSLRVDGRTVSGGLTSSGINIGNLNSNTDKIISFTAILSDNSRIDSSLSSLTNFAEVTSRGTSIAPLAQLPINIIRQAVPATITPRPSSPVKDASQVPTGVGSTIFFPVGLGLLTLLSYLAYSKTSLFKIRELEAEMKREKDDKDRFNMMN